MDNAASAFFCIIPIIFIIIFIVWLMALIDVLKSDFQTENEKIVWVLVIILAGIVGAVLYFAIGEAKRKPGNN